jgi:hypothetical protein
MASAADQPVVVATQFLASDRLHETQERLRVETAEAEETLRRAEADEGETEAWAARVRMILCCVLYQRLELSLDRWWPAELAGEAS